MEYIISGITADNFDRKDKNVFNIEVEDDSRYKDFNDIFISLDKGENYILFSLETTFKIEPEFELTTVDVECLQVVVDGLAITNEFLFKEVKDKILEVIKVR